MGNTVSSTVSQCDLCEKSLPIHALTQLQLCVHDYDYIVRLVNGDASKGFSKCKIAALVIFVSFGSYLFGHLCGDLANEEMINQLKRRLTSCEQEITSLTVINSDFSNSDKDAYFMTFRCKL